MRKIVALTLALLGTAMLMAQDRDRDRVQDSEQDRDRLMLVDGEVLQIRDQDQIRLQDPVTLNDGTVVNPNGSYLTKDRVRLRLKDGECLDNEGNKYRNEYQYRHKIMQEDKGLTNAQIQQRNQNRFQIMRIDGEVYQIRTRSQERLQQRLELSNGGSIDPDGTYMTQDRKQLRLQNGECMNLSGEKFRNMHQHRKMMLQKNMKNMKDMKTKKGLKGNPAQKKKGSNV